MKNIAIIREAISAGNWLQACKAVEEDEELEYVREHVRSTWGLDDDEIEDFDFETAAQITVIGYYEAGRFQDILDLLPQLEKGAFTPDFEIEGMPVQHEDRTPFLDMYDERTGCHLYHTPHSIWSDLSGSYEYEEAQDLPPVKGEHALLISKLWGVFEDDIPECIWEEGRLDIDKICKDLYDFLKEKG